MAVDDLLDDGLVLFALGLVDAVVVVLAETGAVGGDDEDVEAVDGLEFVGLGLGGAVMPASFSYIRK